jgi:hypothetical protein
VRAGSAWPDSPPEGIEVSSDVWHCLGLAAEPWFDRWREQVTGTGGCADPLHLTGGSTMVVAGTGEVVHRYSTDREPGGHLLVACGNRRASRCLSCARTYHGDTFHLNRAALIGGKGVPETVRAHPRVFVTFTAHGFGPVHHRVIGTDGSVLRCNPRAGCRRKHKENDPRLGHPLIAASYDYDGVILWNRLAPRLWEKTMDLLAKDLARLAHFSQREFRKVGRASYGKVQELQLRGSYHYHAVIRLDGMDPDDRDAVVIPGDWGTAELLERAIRSAVARAVVIGPDGRKIRWGEQLDIKPIVAFGAAENLTDEAVAAYVAKYATKGSEDVCGAIDRSLCCRPCQGTGRRKPGNGSTDQMMTVECGSCQGTGAAVNLSTLPVSDHARRLIQACWDLGGRSDLAGLHLRRWAHMLGSAGHFCTHSRRYSTTLTALRQARRSFQTAHTLQRHGLDRTIPVARYSVTRPVDEVDADGVIVLGHWRYDGRGHGEREAWWAANIARDLDENRKLAREAVLEERAEWATLLAS